MLRGHVFIVNEDTLPKHLEYSFVGTSAGGRDNNISLLADMFRIKADDFIFFYIEGKPMKKGRFFGIFKAVDNQVYHLVGEQAKEPNLSVKLIYRKRIKPYKVYANGVLEWIALDKLPTYSKELLWTLIYRKMKGQRGNTMLLPWEIERLISLIEDENNGQYYINEKNYSFDKSAYKIVPYKSAKNLELGELKTITQKEARFSETYFQAFILYNLNYANNKFYPNIFGKNLIWIGNEVFAGAGMQKIDLLTIEKLDETSNLFRLIELKLFKPNSAISADNLNYAPMQLEYYVRWAREDIGGHLLGSRKFNIKPILIVFTTKPNSLPAALVDKMRFLRKIALEPEIYEIDFDFNVKRIL